MHPNNRKKVGIISSFIVCCILIIVIIVFVVYRQRVIDQITVWQYRPTSDVISLADRAGLNDNGRFYYMASQPKLYPTSDTIEFDKICNRAEYSAAILGCYNNFRIYIKDITDQQLDGIREVTATHETLHAIYDRLSNNEKTKVDKLLESEYNRLADDINFSDLMAFYASSEPGQRENELHSIIGVEISDISPELEAYYDKYFANRQKVVDLNDKYKGVFKALKDRADDISAQLVELSEAITSKSIQYNIDINTLNDDIELFNDSANNGGFSSQSQFNSARTLLINRATNLDLTRSIINSEIINYNALDVEYESITIESKNLYNLMENPLAPVPSV